jgi:geranylgeranyl pyrophosphate synthase
MIGLERAKEMATRLREEAQAALAVVQVDTGRLAALTDYIADRSF